MTAVTGQEVPLVDLALQHDAVALDVLAGLVDVMAAGQFIGGREVAAFESGFAAFCGRRHCAATGSSTDAVELMVRAAGLEPHDEVIVPANAPVATVAAILRTGAVPVFVDCDSLHYLIDAAAIGERMTPLTRAILAVHLFGQMAAMEELMALASSAGLVLLEDAVHAHGATRFAIGPGGWGRAAAFSFHPEENLGAYGDAGAVVTDDPELAASLWSSEDGGRDQRDARRVLSWNSRLDTMQAVVLSAKLRFLTRWNRQRAAAAGRYEDLLSENERIVLPAPMPGNNHAWHAYVVRVEERDRIRADLHAAGISTDVHSPTPVHLLPAFRSKGYAEGMFPNVERAARETLSLPIYPGIEAEQIEYVAEVLRQVVG